MGLWFVLLAVLPIIYNLYNSNKSYLPIIPMQSSKIQTLAFILYMLSIYCASSMLPCGRYYYAPEGVYVGNPWVKFSYQYAYLYMAWIVHHLDLIEHVGYRYAQHLLIQSSNTRKISKKRTQVLAVTSIRESANNKNALYTFSNTYKSNQFVTNYCKNILR